MLLSQNLINFQIWKNNTWLPYVIKWIRIFFSFVEKVISHILYSVIHTFTSYKQNYHIMWNTSIFMESVMYWYIYRCVSWLHSLRISECIFYSFLFFLKMLLKENLDNFFLYNLIMQTNKRIHLNMTLHKWISTITKQEAQQWKKCIMNADVTFLKENHNSTSRTRGQKKTMLISDLFPDKNIIVYWELFRKKPQSQSFRHSC